MKAFPTPGVLTTDLCPGGFWLAGCLIVERRLKYFNSDCGGVGILVVDQGTWCVGLVGFVTLPQGFLPPVSTGESGEPPPETFNKL